jgi:ATP-dependent Clp protease ATP-binding subunit ClpA
MSELQDRFTARARQAIERANEEARRFNHEYIGTEHVLLALTMDEESMAGRVLEKLRSRSRIRLAVERMIRKGPVMVTMGSLPQNFQTKMAIHFAMEEATELNHNYVGTEHILLGLVRESSGAAGCILMIQGLDLDKVRQEVLNSLDAAANVVAIVQLRARAETPDWIQPRLRSKSQAPVAKRGGPRVGKIIPALAWFFLAVGIFGVAVGVSVDSMLTLPGTILVGASIIALALGRR